MPIVEYYRPGDPAMEPAIIAAAQDARAVLLANHGPVVSGETLTDAVYAAEELEEAAKLYPDAAPRRTAAADAAAGAKNCLGEKNLSRCTGEVARSGG